MGVELLRGEFSPSAVYMVAHHHQRFDGSGFPKVKPRDPASEAAGLRGEKIHIFARILAVADAFDHLLGTPQAPKPTIQALHALQQPHFAGWFDPLVVAAVNRLIPPFMIGSVVTLTDGQEAVVTDNHAVAPCRPTVRIISGGLGTPGTSVHDEDLDLRTTLGLSVGEVDGIDVRPFFFEPPDIPEGVMAYWGLRSKAVKTASVDPVELLPAQETVPARS